MIGKAYARPFESSMLDRLQSSIYASQFCLLFMGLLFATDKGKYELNELGTKAFMIVFWITSAQCGFMVYRDLRYLSLQY